MSPYFEAALKSFAEWLSSHKSGYEQFSIRKSGVTADDMSEMVKEWITRMTSPNVETQTWDLEGPFLPVYIVDCPKLHVIPKKFLAYKLRWLDKWAYEVRLSMSDGHYDKTNKCKAIQENSPIVNWKEGE